MSSASSSHAGSSMCSVCAACSVRRFPADTYWQMLHPRCAQLARLADRASFPPEPPAVPYLAAEEPQHVPVENEGLGTINDEDENEDEENDVEIRDMVAAVTCSNKNCADVYAVKFRERDDAEDDPEQVCTIEWRCRSCGDDLEIIQAWRDDGS